MDPTEEALISAAMVAFTAVGAYTVVHFGRAGGEVILYSILGYGSLCVAYEYAYKSEGAHADMMKLVTGTIGYTIGTGGWPYMRAVLRGPA